MIIYPEGIFYCQVQAEDVPEIVEETLVKGRVVERLRYHDPAAARRCPTTRTSPSTASRSASRCATAA